MATAKLWWNGSSWVTSDTTCANKTSKSSEAGSRPGIRGTIKLVAYDNGKVKLYASLVPDGVSGSGNTLGGTFTISFAGTTITVTDGSSKTGDTRYTWSGEISAETGTISYNTGSQNITCVYYIGGAKYCSPLSFNGSVSVGSSPFRTITFNANNGTGAPAAQTVCVNASATLTAGKPTRTGYTFLGWSTSKTATTATYTAGGTITVSADTTLYAVWQANSFGLSITKPATASVTILKNGEAFTGTTVNYDDVLTITATPTAGYRIVTLTVNGSDFVSGSTHTVTGAVAIEVTTIAQSSTIATYDTTVNTLDTFNLTVNRYSTSHYNKLRYYDSNDELLFTSDVFTEGTSLIVPQSWFTNYGTVTSIQITAILTTYTEPECINITGVTETCTFTVTADASMKPTLAAGVITLTPYNTGTGAANLSNPGYVKGYSKIQAVFDTSKITHAVGASAGSYAISVQGIQTTGSTTTIVSGNTLTAAGQLTVTYTVTDSRGRSTTATEVISVNDYANPAIASLNCYRCDIDGTEDENENYMAVTASCTFTTLSDNAITITVEAKPVGGSYTSYGTILNAIKAVIGGAFLPDTSYYVKVTVTDTVGNSAYTEMSMPRRSWIFHMRQSLGGPGAAFGKVTENDYTLQLANGWKFMMDNTIMTEADLAYLLDIDTAIANAVAEKVSKSGDTMTGNLAVSTNSAPTIVIKNTDMDSATQSLANAEYSYLFFDDVNDAHIALLYAGEETSGRNTFRLRCRKVVSGSDVNHGVFLRIDKNGNRDVTFDDADAWLTGLGLGSVTSTSTISDVLTAASGTTINSVTFAKWGKVAMLAVNFKRTTAITSSSSTTTIATLKTGHRPASWAQITHAYGNLGGAVSTDGTIQVAKCVGTTDIAANTNVTLRSMYILA